MSSRMNEFEYLLSPKSDEVDASSADVTTFFRQRLEREKAPPARSELAPEDRTWRASVPFSRVNFAVRYLERLVPRIDLRHPNFAFTPLQSLPAKTIRQHAGNQGWGQQHRVPDINADRIVRAESHLEHEFARELILDCSATSFAEQAVRLRYRNKNGRLVAYTPDFGVVRLGDVTFSEVKFEIDASTSDNEHKWELVGQAFAELGFNFNVITERHLRNGDRKEIVNEVFSAQRRFPELELIADTISVLQVLRGGSLSAGELRARLPGLSRQDLLAFRYHRIINFDLGQQINDQTHVYLGANAKAPRGSPAALRQLFRRLPSDMNLAA